MQLPDFLQEKYTGLKPAIQKRLAEFATVPEEDYFYELCFCVCTPQSKARSAYAVEQKLRASDFQNKPYDPTPLLRDPEHYIRFHNQKAARLLYAREFFPVIKEKLDSEETPEEKRLWLADNFKGFGMKESAHYLRNIGYRNLGILDRHILKHLVSCRVFDEVPKIGSRKAYMETEKKYLEFANNVKIPVDELDLLFWSYEAGEILK